MLLPAIFSFSCGHTLPDSDDGTRGLSEKLLQEKIVVTGQFADGMQDSEVSRADGMGFSMDEEERRCALGPSPFEGPAQTG